MYLHINGVRHILLNVVDAGTRYGERNIAQSLSAMEMKRLFEYVWFYTRSVPWRFSADHGFCRPILSSFMKHHGVEVIQRPSRSSHKNGTFERSIGVFKNVSESIGKTNSLAAPDIIIHRTSLIWKLFRGSKLLSSFEMARGMRPLSLSYRKRLSLRIF